MKKNIVLLSIGIILILLQIEKYLNYSKIHYEKISETETPFYIFDKIGFYLGFNILLIIGVLLVYFGYFKKKK